MNELQELARGKTVTQLLTELQFQINMGESLGGTICSYLMQNIINQPIIFTNQGGIEFKMAIGKIELPNNKDDSYVERYFKPEELVLYTTTEATWFPHHANEFSDIN